MVNTYLDVLKRGWPLLVVFTLLAGLWAVATMPKEQEVALSTSYRAEAVLLQAVNSSVPVSYLNLYAKQGAVPERVAERIGYQGSPEGLAQQVTMVASQEDPLITITASGSEADSTAELANAFADELALYVTENQVTTREARVGLLESALKALKENLADAEAALADNPGNALLGAQRDAYVQRYQSTYQELIAALGEEPGGDLSTFQRAEAIPISSGGFTVPVDPFPRILLFGGLAFALVLLGLLVIERFDPRIRTRGALEDSFGLPTLVIIPKIAPDGPGDEPLAVRDPSAAAVDAFRGLRAALQAVAPRPQQDSTTGDSGHPMPKRHVVLLTAAHAGVGVTTTVANLAAVLADAGTSVLAIDANLRSGALTERMGGKAPGLVDAMAKDRSEGQVVHGERGDASSLESYIGASSVPGVDVMGAGVPGVYRGTDRARVDDTLRAARQYAEITVVDGEPLLEGVQSLDFAPHVDGVLVVGRLGLTTRDDAARVASLLSQVGAPCLGLVVVSAPPPRGRRFLGWARKPAGKMSSPAAEVGQAVPIGRA